MERGWDLRLKHKWVSKGKDWQEFQQWRLQEHVRTSLRHKVVILEKSYQEKPVSLQVFKKSNFCLPSHCSLVWNNKGWKKLNSYQQEYKNERWHGHTVGYYGATKKNESLYILINNGLQNTELQKKKKSNMINTANSRYKKGGGGW